jgi:DNA-binding response OmpR family regulator
MRKLLIVDDDESLRRLMRIELTDTFEIIDSGEPDQGLALAMEYRPDVILVDLRMPKYSGFELLQTYTTFSQTQNIPIVVVSGEAGSQTKEQCRKLGAAGYFEKPIDFDALRICLADLVKKRKRDLPRTEVRVRLSLQLKLRGLDLGGNMVEGAAMTENVSLHGFLCNSSAEFARSSTVDVYLSSYKNTLVGKARIMQVEARDGKRNYDCQFLEKPREWVLH